MRLVAFRDFSAFGHAKKDPPGRRTNGNDVMIGESQLDDDEPMWSINDTTSDLTYGSEMGVYRLPLLDACFAREWSGSGAKVA
ncbi:hypothetical protein Taro_013049 [Colocasia esculenta]|uniref:Uncharacterized protein n=1 Tax=Colocasia esculenta TaxID=4460 RepID=A0A843UET8_COLES|nr:hypothetical protein [Colocasia esculenta]